MAYLHNNKDQFQDAIELAYEQTGVMAQAIEKDYAKVTFDNNRYSSSPKYARENVYIKASSDKV
nr:hypothetical protein [uncultured Anaerobutyricum sp.]